MKNKHKIAAFGISVLSISLIGVWVYKSNQPAVQKTKLAPVAKPINAVKPVVDAIQHPAALAPMPAASESTIKMDTATSTKCTDGKPDKKTVQMKPKSHGIRKKTTAKTSEIKEDDYQIIKTMVDHQQWVDASIKLRSYVSSGHAVSDLRWSQLQWKVGQATGQKDLLKAAGQSIVRFGSDQAALEVLTSSVGINFIETAQHRFERNPSLVLAKALALSEFSQKQWLLAKYHATFVLERENSKSMQIILEACNAHLGVSLKTSSLDVKERSKIEFIKKNLGE